MFSALQGAGDDLVDEAGLAGPGIRRRSACDSAGMKRKSGQPLLADRRRELVQEEQVGGGCGRRRRSAPGGARPLRDMVGAGSTRAATCRNRRRPAPAARCAPFAMEAGAVWTLRRPSASPDRQPDGSSRPEKAPFGYCLDDERAASCCRRSTGRCAMEKARVMPCPGTVISTYCPAQKRSGAVQRQGQAGGCRGSALRPIDDQGARDGRLHCDRPAQQVLVVIQQLHRDVAIGQRAAQQDVAGVTRLGFRTARRWSISAARCRHRRAATCNSRTGLPCSRASRRCLVEKRRPAPSRLPATSISMPTGSKRTVCVACIGHMSCPVPRRVAFLVALGSGSRPDRVFRRRFSCSGLIVKPARYSAMMRLARLRVAHPPDGAAAGCRACGPARDPASTSCCRRSADAAAA